MVTLDYNRTNDIQWQSRGCDSLVIQYAVIKARVINGDMSVAGTICYQSSNFWLIIVYFQNKVIFFYSNYGI